MNLANVWRDSGRLEDALKQYQEAGAVATSIGEREIEASTSRVSSAVYLQIGKGELAIEFATYAVGLLRNTTLALGLIECLEQLGDSYDRVGRSREAANAYVEAALTAKERDIDEAWRLAGHGMDLFAKLNDIDAYLLTIDRLSRPQGDADRDETLPKGDRLCRRIPLLLDSVSQDYAIGVLGVLFRLLFEGVPAPVAQFLFEHLSGQIIELARDERPAWRVLFPLMPLLTAIPHDGLTIGDTVALGYALSARVPGLHYKAEQDGAPHWNLVLVFPQPVICSVVALDSEVETAMVCTLIALFLKGFEAEVRDRIVGQGAIGQQEVRMFVGSSVAIPADVAPRVWPQSTEGPCLATRPTDFREGEVIPTYLFFKEGIAKDWMPGSGKGSSMQVLLATALLELVFQLFRGEIELEVLQPKIKNLMRRTIS